MKKDRHLKICFDKMKKKMYIGSKAGKKFNWLNQLHTLLCTINKQFISELEDPGVFLVTSYMEEQNKQKLLSPPSSSYPQMYTESNMQQTCLALNKIFPMFKSLAQIRLSGNHHIKFTYNNIYIIISNQKKIVP